MLKFAGAVVLALLSISGCDAADYGCHRNGILWNGFCYEYVSVRFDSYDAVQNYCNDDGFEVASIHSAQENDFVANLIDGDAIIGLRSLNNVLFWMDGTPVDYTNFDSYRNIKSGNCVAIKKDGTWSTTACVEHMEGDGFACKIPAVQLTPDCPSSSTFYDVGELSSPSYPYHYDSPMDCKYQLAAKNEYYIVVRISFYPAEERQGDVIKVYEGWTENDAKLLRLIQDRSEGTYEAEIIVSSSNRVLIVFSGRTVGSWYGDFYSTKSVPKAPSLRPVQHGRSMLAQSYSKYSNPLHGCPEGNVFADGDKIYSPNNPFGYDPDIDCTYYAANTTDPYGDIWKVYFHEVLIGDDDYFELVDIRTNTVFASTKDIVHMYKKLFVPFDFAIHFHSGGNYGMLDRWDLGVWRTSEKES